MLLTCNMIFDIGNVLIDFCRKDYMRSLFGENKTLMQAAPGIFVYQMTTKGLAVELSLKGTNYYRDKKLNDPNVK